MIIGLCQNIFQVCGQRAQPLLILGSKATEDRAVDIQNANNLIFNHQRQYDFRIAAGIAGDVAVKRMNIFDTLNLTGRHCGTAHAATYRDTHAGEFPLERPQYQRVAFQQIKARPVHVRKAFEQ